MEGRNHETQVLLIQLSRVIANLVACVSYSKATGLHMAHFQETELHPVERLFPLGFKDCSTNCIQHPAEFDSIAILLYKGQCKYI